MPSIRIRHHDSYASLHEEPNPELLSPRSLSRGTFTAPATPAGSTVRGPRPRPSLPVLKSGEVPTLAAPIRPSTAVSRIQSHVFRDSDPNSRYSTYRGRTNSSIGGSEFTNHQRHTGSTAGGTGAADEGWVALHHDDIVDHLDVIDPQVGAVSTLTNAANSIIIPPTPFYDRKPTIILPINPQPEAEGNLVYHDALDRHVDDVIKRPFPIRRTLLGVWAFLKTPMGLITGIYGFLVVFWGAAIVIFLARIINLHNADLQGFWVEVSSQVVNGLFTAVNIGLIPSRVIDTYRVCKIWHYKRKTIRLRKEAGLPQLFDLDDLPDPCYDSSYVRVLTDEEQEDLHRRAFYPIYHWAEIQPKTSISEHVKFQYHQTWYRAHGGETHRIILCGTMWGLNRFQRPAWSTGTLIPASFLCGIGAAIFIWRGGERTKRVDEIRQKLRNALAEIPHRVEVVPPGAQPTMSPFFQPTNIASPIDGPELSNDVNSSSEKLTRRDTDHQHQLSK
ncbi:hypothetical protein NP233_g7021 [Leucocoprinus birnbaumii]|uniref:Uncharacterized protein n=1 Tax=Leucocoprinus birnbaumii TaxID=56174 RepID=A0AAD5VTA3_9AGAR|nr:hypothetical protein NP233_g7021 [Leucocoprinus birnbaumii]